MFTSRDNHLRRYRCSPGPDHRGCGHISVAAAPLERFLTDAVFRRLDSTGLADALARTAGDNKQIQTLAQFVEQAQERLTELAHAYGTGQISMSEWLTARQAIDNRLEPAQRNLAVATHPESIEELIGNGEQVRIRWSNLTTARQREILSALIDRVEIGPGRVGGGGFDPRRAAIIWRN